MIAARVFVIAWAASVIACAASTPTGCEPCEPIATVAGGCSPETFDLPPRSGVVVCGDRIYRNVQKVEVDAGGMLTIWGRDDVLAYTRASDCNTKGF